MNDPIVAFIYIISFGEYVKIGKTCQRLSDKQINRFQQYTGVFRISLLIYVDPDVLDDLETRILCDLNKTFKLAKGREYFYGDEATIRTIVANHCLCLPLPPLDPNLPFDHLKCIHCDKMLCTTASLKRHQNKCGAKDSPEEHGTISVEQYEDAKVLSDLTIQGYEALKTVHKASFIVKQSIKAFHFFNKCIKSVSIQASWEFELFLDYTSSPLTKAHIQHILFEINVNASVKKHTSDLLAVIQNVCNILHLKNSFDTVNIFEDNELLQFKCFYQSNADHIDKLFQINAKPTKSFKFRQAISTINYILKAWNGFSVQVVSSRNEYSRKKKNMEYVCKLVNNSIVGQYALLLPLEG